MGKQLKLELIVDDKGTAKIKNFDKAVSKSMKGLKKDADGLSKSTKGTQSSITGLKGSFGSLNPSLLASGAAMAALTAAAVGVGAGLMKAAQIGMQFETTMKTVQAVSRASAEEYKQLEDAARKMGATTEWSASQSANALKFMSMAGMEVADSINALPGMLDLATAAQMDLASASDIVTDTLTAFGMETSELTRLSDAFINTSTRSNTTVQMLGESFKYAAPIAANMGYTVEQTASMLGVMANAGIKASDAGTDLRQVMLRTAKAATSLGMDAGASLNEVLTEMAKRQMTANEVTELFGMIASKSAIVLMNNVDAVGKLNQELVNNQGATKTTADVMRSSTENMAATFSSAMQEIGLSIFDVMEDDLKEALSLATEFLNDNKAVFVDWSGKIIKVASVAFKALLLGAGLVSDAFNGWAMIFESVKLAFMVFAEKFNQGFLDIITNIDSVMKRIPKLRTDLGGAIVVLSKNQSYWSKQIKDSERKLYELGRGGSKTYNALISVIGDAQNAQKKLAIESKSTGKTIKSTGKTIESSVKSFSMVHESGSRRMQTASKNAAISSIQWWTGAWNEIDRKSQASYSTFEKNEAAKAEKAAKVAQRIQDANGQMYTDLGSKADGYYEYHKGVLDQQLIDFQQLGVDEVLAAEWFKGEYKKILDQQTLDHGTFLEGVGLGLTDFVEKDMKTWAEAGKTMSKTMAEGMSKNMGDLFFTAVTGDFDSMSEAWDALWQSMLRTLVDTVAQMVTQWAITKVLGFGTSLFGDVIGDFGGDIVSDIGGSLFSAASPIAMASQPKMIDGSFEKIGGAPSASQYFASQGAPTITYVADPITGQLVPSKNVEKYKPDPSVVTSVITSTESTPTITYVADKIIDQLIPSKNNEKYQPDPSVVTGTEGSIGMNGGEFLSELTSRFLKSMGVKTGVNIAAFGEKGFDASLDPSSIASSLGGAFSGVVNEALGMNTSKWGTFGQTAGKVIGGFTGGPVGGLAGGLSGGTIGMGLGDLFNARGGATYYDEEFRDLIEDEVGWFEAQKQLGKIFRDYVQDAEYQVPFTPEDIKILSQMNGGPLNRDKDKDTTSDSDVGGGYERESSPGGMGGFARGGVIRKLIAEGDDGLISAQSGEGVISREGMANLSKLNNGGFGSSRPINITIQVGNEEFGAYVGAVADDIRVKANRRKLTTQRIY